VAAEVIVMEAQSYDVVVAGGGAAGVRAALVLGRAAVPATIAYIVSAG
jgi:succinate dehydrogenase/fumarate reductase flavoprotein subunit